jgi:uncharacterized protein YbjT (DUF2867 family)
MNGPIVTVFGGTGFLGRRIVRRLREAGSTVRVASRHPHRAVALFGADDAKVQAITCDVTDEPAVAAAVAGVDGIVNAVSLYLERGKTFRSVHVAAAARIARQAHERRVARLVHVSGIGANASSHSPYVRSRGEGEAAVRAAFPQTAIVRPSVMFGPDDAFLTALAPWLQRLPAYPLFGEGRTRLQPVYVEDVANAIVHLLLSKEAPHAVYELGGPRIYSYHELLSNLAKRLGVRPLLVPTPFPLWHVLAYGAEMLPRPPVTRAQVELMRADNVVSSKTPGFGDLGIVPRNVEDVLSEVFPAASLKH